MIKKLTLYVFLSLFCLFLNGCAWFCLYRPPVQQGNLINEEAVGQLRPGISANQVVYLMGTPILTNTFQPNRWDYVYTCKKGNTPRFQRHITLIFDNSILRYIHIAPCEHVG